MASSTATQPLRLVSKLEMKAQMNPMKMDAPTPTNPAAGVYTSTSSVTVSTERETGTHDSNETGNGTRDPSDSGPLPLETPVHQEPGQRPDGSSNVGVDDRKAGLEVGSERRSTLRDQKSLISNSGSREGRRRTLNPSHPTQRRTSPR